MEIFPTIFLDSYEVEGHKVKYSNFIEIVQGGPEVAALSVDGRLLGEKTDYFGGQPFFYQGKMFVPRLKKALLGRHFKMCVIEKSFYKRNLRQRRTGVG